MDIATKKPTLEELLAQQTAIAAAIEAATKEVNVAKAAFLDEFKARVAGLVPPSSVNIALTLDKDGSITSIQYVTNEPKSAKKAHSTGNANSVPIPETGSLCLRMHHAKRHTLLVRGERDLLLDKTEQFSEMTPAWRKVIGKKLGEPGSSVDGRRAFITEGIVFAPSEVENGDVKPGTIKNGIVYNPETV